MTITEQVLIEFVSDSTGLQPAEDKLAALGKIDKASADVFKKSNTELQKRVQLQNAVAQSSEKVSQQAGKIKTSIADVDKHVKNFILNFVKGFQEGVEQELQNAGKEIELFKKKNSDLGAAMLALQEKYDDLAAQLAKLNGSTDGAGKSTDSLKAKLRQMQEQLIKMQLAGQGGTQAFKKLEAEAGHLKDTMADVSAGIRNVGSDTSSLDGLVGIASGISGAFSAAQGAVALFGNESEELQEVLLRVNAAMAITQGLTQLQNVLQKESSASKLADIIVTRAQTAAQTAFNFVVGASTGILKIFRIALAATGVGLLVIGLIELVSALQSTDEKLKDVNFELDLMRGRTQGAIEAIEDFTERQIAQAKAVGKAESELIKLRGKGGNQQIEALREENKRLAKRRDELDSTSEAYHVLNNAIEENNKKIKDLNNDALILNIELQKQIAKEAFDSTIAGLEARLAASKKNSKEELEIQKQLLTEKANFELQQEGLTANQRAAITKKTQRAQRELDNEFAKVRQQDRISALEVSLIAEQKASQAINQRIGQEEIDIQKQLIREKANLELLQEGLTINQILQIRKKAIFDINKLQKDFNQQSTKDTLQDLISRNNAELQQIELTNDEKLRLQIENIITQSEIELEENKGLSDKIKEITAKRDADIKALRRASIRETAEYEVAIERAKGAAAVRELKRRLDAQDEIKSASTKRERRELEKSTGQRELSLQEQFALIDLLTNHELEAIGIRIEALNDSLSKGLISQRQYNLEYEGLVDEQAGIVEDAEERKRRAAKKTLDQQKEQVKSAVQNVLQVYAIAVNTLSELYNVQALRENQHLDDQKRKLAELKEAGAITEKEEKLRLRKLEAEERLIKARQAKRDKQIAVFQSILAIPGSFLRGLRDGGLPLAIVYGALAAVQAALVASRPIPKFKTGKKDSYTGPGEVGEAGAELIEQGGKLFIAKKSTLIWLGPKDKVYNPAETKKMLSKPMPQVNKAIMNHVINHNSTVAIDYEKLGKSVGKNIPQPILNITAEGMSQLSREGNSTIEYLEKRRSFKR